jgi:hypothetical protein
MGLCPCDPRCGRKGRGSPCQAQKPAAWKLHDGHLMLITRPQKQVWTLSAMTAGGGVNLRGSVTWRLCNGRDTMETRRCLDSNRKRADRTHSHT